MTRVKASDTLRAQAADLRAMAAAEADPGFRAKLEALAIRCEKLANQMQGNGHAKD